MSDAVFGALARAEALAAGDPDWMNVTRWPREAGRLPSWDERPMFALDADVTAYWPDVRPCWPEGVCPQTEPHLPHVLRVGDICSGLTSPARGQG